MDNKLFFDTETCGLHGPAVLIQYAFGDADVDLWEVWREPVKDTIDLIKAIAVNPDGVVGFNLAFDWFHLCQLVTTLLLIDDHSKPPSVEEYAAKEKAARLGPCLRPAKACDLMLFARKGPYQSMMNRRDIKIRRVPAVLADKLAAELNRRCEFKPIYFAKAPKRAKAPWQVLPSKNPETGKVDPFFREVVLKFKPSSSLKAIVADALNAKDQEIARFLDIEPPANQRPDEYGWAPYQEAVQGRRFKNKLARPWPEVIEHHIDHWRYYKPARRYAEKDVIYTRDLYKHFGEPELGDVDSDLACYIAAARWRGFAIDKEAMAEVVSTLDANVKGHKININSAEQVKAWLSEVVSEVEELAIKDTSKPFLEELAELTFGNEATPHPVAERAKTIIRAREDDSLKDDLLKLLHAERFHASFNVIGTLSTRMSGSDGLNPQGINKEKFVRRCFPLADQGLVLTGGDFSGFEVALAEAVYNDPDLRKVLLSGYKLHAIFGMDLYPGNTYDQIKATDGTKNDLYTKAKSGVFAMIFGGDGGTLHRRLSVPLEQAEKAYIGFGRRFPGIEASRNMIFEGFCALRQPNGQGTQVYWHEPKEFVESFLGFRRYFTIENYIMRILYDLGNKPPEEWKRLKVKVRRRKDGTIQTASGATQSALFGAAFGIQGSNMRAASNHIIQSPGAQINKDLQRKLASHQPAGLHPWVVATMNVHDEVMAVVHHVLLPDIMDDVNTIVEKYKPQVPLLAIDWHPHNAVLPGFGLPHDYMNNWADK